ncbi:Receptor-transporting protein 2 [Bagarius yarrelli]|uniref:Receptor-transporting protein 2 n=1 Tax=Bagarius yarrelli TaxID=175774 RepID=A0A556TSE9_BAGYA|nr:Receptor-transporting protein 2 [Bagarius yarrelli]
MAPTKIVRLTFTDVLYSGVYYVAVFNQEYKFEESNRVNLTVHPAEYTTTYTSVPSFNITSFQIEQSERKFSIAILVSALFVVLMLVIVLLGLFHWNHRKKTDKTPAVNTTSAPQASPVPDVTSVEYCVLDFPKRPGEKVRSTEEPVEYSPIVLDAAAKSGSVMVRRFKQECRRCNARRLENPSFSNENIDVMVEKLIEKIKCRCYGLNVGQSNRSSRFDSKVNGPHERAHCEACKLGICQQGT